MLSWPAREFRDLFYRTRGTTKGGHNSGLRHMCAVDPHCKHPAVIFPVTHLCYWKTKYALLGASLPLRQSIVGFYLVKKRKPLLGSEHDGIGS